MCNSLNRYNACEGMEIRAKDGTKGILSNVQKDDGHYWGMCETSNVYEIRMCELEEVCDLTNGEHYLRFR